MGRMKERNDKSNQLLYMEKTEEFQTKVMNFNFRSLLLNYTFLKFIFYKNIFLKFENLV